jgi:hypothetical protein
MTCFRREMKHTTIGSTPVQHESNHRLNPLDSILRQCTEDDYVVVKLDIDTASIGLHLPDSCSRMPT